MNEDRFILEQAMRIVAAEETAHILSQEMSKTQLVVKVKPKPSLIVDRKNIMVDGEDTIIDAQGMGVLQELMLKSSSTSFNVSVFKDDKLEINGSYSHYAEISQEVTEVSAYQRGTTGVYIFHVSDIEFERSLIVRIQTAAPVTFTRIFAKYKLG